MIDVYLQGEHPTWKMLIKYLVYQAGIDFCNCTPEFLATPGCYCPCAYSWIIDEFSFDVHSCRIVINGKEYWLKAQASTREEHDLFEKLIGQIPKDD